MDCRHGSSGGVPPLQARSPVFKPQSLLLPKKRKKSLSTLDLESHKKQTVGLLIRSSLILFFTFVSVGNGTQHSSTELHPNSILKKE
jgi:hypothetical protein